MKLLRTSDGVTNPSIHSALVQLLDKPIARCHALVVPTAQWDHPMCGPASVRGLLAADPEFRHLSGLGWASLGVLELTALPTTGAERWVPWLREADVLLVDSGDATYLCHWMRESGLAELLLVGYSNDLGLLSEEYDTVNHRMAGNFPKAFSHLALIRAADALHSVMLDGDKQMRQRVCRVFSLESWPRRAAERWKRLIAFQLRGTW